MQPIRENSKYNFIYNKLVTNKDDLVGMVAYTIYKNEKITYIKNYELEYGGKSPSEEDLHIFHKSSCDRVEYYKELAINRVSSFVDALQVEQKEQLEKVYKDRLIEELKNSKPGILSQLFYSTASAVLSSIIILVLMLCFTVYTIGPADFLDKAADKIRSSSIISTETE